MVFPTRASCLSKFPKLVPSAFILGMIGGILVSLTICFLFRQITQKNYSGDLIQVAGNSMIPSLYGGTIFETCPLCRMHGPRSDYGTSVCPNCGWMIHEKIRTSRAYLQKCRQEVRFDELLEVIPQEKYFQDDIVVAIPNEKIGPVIKRIAGLPGDRLEVRDGILYRNGQRTIHSLETWKQMRIPVFSDDFRPQGISRWIPFGSVSATASVSEAILNETPQGENLASNSASRFLNSQINALIQEQNALNSSEQEDSSFYHSKDYPRIPGITCLPNGWRFNSSIPCGIKYVHQAGRFISSDDGKVSCCLEPAPITNYRAENGTQFPSHAIGMIRELLCSFEIIQIPEKNPPKSEKPVDDTPNFRLVISLPTLTGEHFFVLIPQSESKESSELKAEIQDFFASSPTEIPSPDEWNRAGYSTIDVSCFRIKNEILAEETHSLLFSTLDGIPRLTLDDVPLKEFITFSLPSPIVSSTCRSASAKTFAEQSPPTKPNAFPTFDTPLHAQSSESENSLFSFPTAKIWCWGNQKTEISRLQLFRGEYWEKNLTKFHKISKNGKKTLAFDCKSEYYLVGDNFFVSEDSRHWGTVSHSQIQGKVNPPKRTEHHADSSLSISAPGSFD